MGAVHVAGVARDSPASARWPARSCVGGDHRHRFDAGDRVRDVPDAAARAASRRHSSAQVGAGIAAPFFASVCTVRDIVPVPVRDDPGGQGRCGMVAELGAMRVNEEVDAIEVMGISSMAYLVTTRIVAASIVIPPVYLASVAAAQFGAWLTSLVRFHASR